MEDPVLMDGESIVQTCDSSTLHMVGIAVHGFLFLTNYRLMFVAHKNAVLNLENAGILLDNMFRVVSIPLLSVNRIRRDATEEKVTLQCKDHRTVQVDVDLYVVVFKFKILIDLSRCFYLVFSG